MATNKPKRKTYSDEFKEFLVQEAEVSGRSIASIARDNGINQNLLHNWKREQKAKQAQTIISDSWMRYPRWFYGESFHGLYAQLLAHGQHR